MNIVVTLFIAATHIVHVHSSPELVSPVVTLGDGSRHCPSQQQLASARQVLKDHVSKALLLQVSPPQCGEGQWIRVAYLNMKNLSQTCPSAWRVNTTNGVRVCGRPSHSHDMCHGTFYSTGRHSYNKVCGRVIGYQVGHPDAFHSSDSINEAYVEGVSITHGSPRSHIWTYTADSSETSSHTYCPCDSGSTRSPPSYVGNNYYCESGNPNSTVTDYYLYANDPLWDGRQCSSEGTCCSNHRSLPWFSVTLNSSTSDNIEVRICADFNTSEDTPIELLEIYIQ